MVGSNAYKKQENIIENARLEIDKHTLSLEANNKAIAENEKKISEIVKVTSFTKCFICFLIFSFYPGISSVL